MTETTSWTEQPREQQVSDLMAVLDVTRKLAASTELDTLLKAIEESALQVLDCERATIFLHDAATDELYSEVATGVGEIRFGASLGIAGEAFRSAAVVRVPDAYADKRFNPEIDRKTGYRTRSILTFPLRGFDGGAVGVLQVLNKREGTFTEWDEELGRAYGAQAGVAVQRQRLLDEFAQKQKIERDLQVAREVQQALLPEAAPTIPGFDLAGWNKPADETGGDFFDYQPLDDGRVVVMLADATGHGIGAALVASECRSLLRATFLAGSDIDQALNGVNRILEEDLPDDRFLTAFVATLSPDSDKIAFVSAGHGPIILYRAATKECRICKASGLPLSVLADLPYDPPEEFAMEEGDMLLIATDGFDEWSDAEGNPFGTERIEDCLRDHAEEPSSKLIERLYERVLAFTGGTEQRDDLTAIIIKRCASS
ncbi:Phosphoserine phosphatase RsbU [Planctomycetes bacterium Pan216]|uniref:Phosphoserine phosphatase RsbU n=1 Tax=Kolteria novifilia TaxID=2527975 RepID=A0A518B915_9BACT|nr:Phosphoserine phosphatase RsbU [Planctomycetes bacterium Pan216]